MAQAHQNLLLDEMFAHTQWSRDRRARAAVGVGTALTTVGLAALIVTRLRRRGRSTVDDQLECWCGRGPAREPVVTCEVPVSHGLDGAAPEMDAVEVPVGLMFECTRLKSALMEHLKVTDDDSLVKALKATWETDEEEAGPTLNLPWMDLSALAQVTYWYDRRPQGMEEPPPETEDDSESRPVASKFGRWTKKISREKVIYGTVALRYRSRGHLGAQVFRRPAGIDVTRLMTLQRAASLSGHDGLLEIVEATIHQLRPTNIARIPWSEVKKHVNQDDLWLMIDGKVYDVTPFLNLHPGGGQLIVDAAGKDATSAFERTHGEGLRYSLRLLNQFFIGECVGAEEAEPAEETQCSQEFLDTLRSITGALHTFDEKSATGEAQGLIR
uniref:Cytochrome b5 heme-binding domain-containing protein n=1 Tax=Noctiluca scintillans TaxID=2966 RepID=A0A7S1FKZ6_NOCSC